MHRVKEALALCNLMYIRLLATHPSKVQLGVHFAAPALEETELVDGAIDCTQLSTRALRKALGAAKRTVNEQGYASGKFYIVFGPPLLYTRRKESFCKVSLTSSLSSFVSAWDTGSWELMRTRQVAERPATAMEMSPTGRHIALSTSDLSLHLFSTRTLRTVWTLRDAHAFPSTCLAFSPAGDRIVSGSADMSLRIVSVGANADSRLIHNWLNGE